MEFASRPTGVPERPGARRRALILTAGGCRRHRAEATRAGSATPAGSGRSGSRDASRTRPTGRSPRRACWCSDRSATPRRPRRETRPDLGGRFQVRRVAARPVHAARRGRRPGHRSSRRPSRCPAPRPSSGLSGQGRSLSGVGRVARDARAGARVRLGWAASTLARATLSDDAGRFVFHGLGAGDYALRATKGLLASPSSASVPTDDFAAGPTPARTPPRASSSPGLGRRGRRRRRGGRGARGRRGARRARPRRPARRGRSRRRRDGRFAAGAAASRAIPRRRHARRATCCARAASVTLSPDAGPPRRRGSSSCARLRPRGASSTREARPSRARRSAAAEAAPT